MTGYEFRARSKRVPARVFPKGLRIYLGDATTKRERQTLEHHREVLKKIERRGQWDILRAIKDGQVTVDEIVRVHDQSGLDTLHLELKDPGAGEPIGEMVELFLATIEQARTAGKYRTDLDRLVAFVGAATPWDQVGRHQINELLDAMRARGLTPNTRSGARTAWSAFYTWLRDRDESLAELQARLPRTTSHPVRLSQAVKTATTRHRFLAPGELDDLCKVAAPPMRPQYVALAYSGMRIGEFVSRRPDEIEPARRIRIVARDGWAPKGWPRYDHGVRDIPVHQRRLRPALEQYAEEWAGDRYFFVNPRTNERWTHESFRHQLSRDVRAAGLVYGRQADGITPHTFRHTLGSWLAQKDVQLLKIARILGDTVDTVVKYYAHLVPSDLDETINSALEWELVTND